MKIKHILLSMATTLTLVSCVPPPQPTMTPLEIQSLQSRDYEASKEIVFPSIVSVFQDLGYTITNADFETGLISAESSAGSDVASAILLGFTQVTQTKATAFVEVIGGRTKARLNFVEVNSTSSSYGQTNRNDTPLLDAKIYQNAFEQIESAIFIRSQS